MTLKKLSAGSGYEYLTRQVAAADSTELGSGDLAGYYSAKGEAPGKWTGEGLASIEGIEAGDLATAEQMKNLFGTGCDPITGNALGRAYRVYGTEGEDGFNAEVTRRIEALHHPNKDTAARIRTEVATEWFVRKHDREPNHRELSAAIARYSRPRQTTVAGFDLTFSPAKSVSALWAVAPPEVARRIGAAHDAAVRDALTFLEHHAIFTREGTNGVRQVETHGLIGAAFRHRDSRAGDPDLHTHVAVANKVQTRQGKWLSLYGTVLHQHIVAASEAYNTALEHRLRESLGVRFADRQIAVGKRPTREIDGVDQDLCTAWSRRRKDILERQGQLAAEFTRVQGRPPTPIETTGLAQQANLETRDAKHEARSEAEQRATWHREAELVLGSTHAIDQMIATALDPGHTTAPLPTAEWIEHAAAKVISELEDHQATWQTWHLYAEAQRQLRDVDVHPDHVARVVEHLVAAARARLINLTPELDPIQEPRALRRSDGTSVFRHTGADHFTSQWILDAEQRIVEAGRLSRAQTPDTVDFELAVMGAEATSGIQLNPGQRDLVLAMATDPRRLTLALAPAGAGKTTAVRVLAAAWSEIGGEIIGLAPSAAAASVLHETAEIPADTLAKLDHLIATDVQPAMGPRTLVVIDEAGMADTLALDRVVAYCTRVGATVRLIGDDRQLAAVGAGGVLRDLATTHGAQRLDEVIRFTDPIEARASLDLREGDPAALGFYLDHDRVHVGDADTCVDDVLTAWIEARKNGTDCLLLAPTRDLVARLNNRARAARLEGTNPDRELPLRDGNCASAGDLVITRHNDRRLGVSGSDWVKNGDRWTVTGVAPDGSLAVRHTSTHLRTVLPAEYVAAHVDLGFASTVHTAQGLTADVTHGIVTGTEDRRLLYVMLTRGRTENHVHVALDSTTGDTHEPMLPGIVEQLTATETLDAILTRDGAASSATTQRIHTASPATQLRHAAQRYADAVDRAAHLVLRGEAREALDAAVPGPLPWLPGMPAEVAEHPTWSGYLTARAARVTGLADQVLRDKPAAAVVAHLGVVVPDSIRDVVVVWRAANGVPDHDRRLLGARVDDDRAFAFGRRLQRRINELYPPSVRRWAEAVAGVIGHADEATLGLARELDRLQRSGINANLILHRARTAGPLPDERATEALAYRVQLQVKSAHALQPSQHRGPSRQQPGLSI